MSHAQLSELTTDELKAIYRLIVWRRGGIYSAKEPTISRELESAAEKIARVLEIRGMAATRLEREGRRA